MTDPKILPDDPKIGNLVGDGDVTPPDAPPDPLDPDAPTNGPPEPDAVPIVAPEDEPEEKAKAEVDVGPVMVGVESDLQTGATVTIGGRF